MAEKLGEGYIEIFGLDAKFAESMKKVQKQLAMAAQQAKATQAIVSSGSYALASGKGSLSGPSVAARPIVNPGTYALSRGKGPLSGPSVSNKPFVDPGTYSVGSGLGPSGWIPTRSKGMGIFGAGMTEDQVQRYGKMPHPTIPGLNALGLPTTVFAGSAPTKAAGRLASALPKMTGLGGLGSLGGLGGLAAMGGDILPALAGAYVGKKVFDEVGDSIKRGSDMIETGQKLSVVFGAATGSVQRMADEMASKFGNNKAVMLDAAASFGLIGQAAKLTESQSASMAITMTKLADDASSFYNVSMDQALAKIQAGLVGQSKPLREFGVLINIATVNAKALEMGLKRVNGQFSESDKVMARMQLIKEGLAKAKGDRERTIDSPANTMRQLEGEYENYKTEIGMDLAGATAGIVRTAREGGVMGLLKETATGFFSDFTNDTKGGLLSDKFQAAMDKRMGVGSGAMKAPIIVQETPMQKFARERQAYDQFMSDKHMRENDVSGRGFGAFGMMGNLGQMFNRQAMLGGVGTTVEGIDKKISDAQKTDWGGGHVTDTLGFLRQAQENILKPQDETQKQQLAELRAIREAIEKSTPDGKAAGVVVRGRVS